MYLCLGIAGNIFSVRAHAVKQNQKVPRDMKTNIYKQMNYLDNFCKNDVPTKNTPPPIPTVCNISRQIPFFISIFVLKNNYIVVLSQQSVDWMFDLSFSESGTSTCSPIYSNSKDTPNFCENSQVLSSLFPHFKWCFSYLLMVHNSRLNA